MKTYMDYIPSNIQKNWMGLMEYSWDIQGVFLVFFFSSLGQPYRTVAGWIFRYWPSKKRGCQPMNRGIYTKINCRNQQMAISKCRAWSLFILFLGGGSVWNVSCLIYHEAIGWRRFQYCTRSLMDLPESGAASMAFVQQKTCFSRSNHPHFI